MAVADPLNDYAAIERAAIAGDPWALGYVASHQAAVSALADAWDEGRQWLAEQGGDVRDHGDGDPNPYRVALAAAGAGAVEPLTACPRCAATDGAPVTTAAETDAWRCPSCGVVEAGYPGPLAAGAGAEVDRRVQAVFDLMYRRDPFAPEGCVTKSAVISVLNTPDAVLAARGDAATPTEVEWGVRYIDPQGEVHDSPRQDERTARLSVEVDSSVTLVQRDVHRSAWREVEGGEQRG